MKKLDKKIFIELEIILRSGLYIGAGNSSMSIGGPDMTVVRNPINQQPYIPGSSIKGKLRSLLEKLYGVHTYMNEQIEYGPYTSDSNHPICKLFGTATGDKDQIPSRLSVYDSYMTTESVNKLLESQHTDMPFTEVKAEVVIDRVTAAATPRFMERVPAGTSFILKLVLNIFQNGGETNEELKEEESMIKHLKMALLLLEDDYIGGKGSRGSGQFEFNRDKDSVKLTFKDMSVYEGDGIAKKYTGIDQLLPA